MPVDKFGRFLADGIENPVTSANINSSLSFKKYIDECLRKTKDDIEKQLNSLLVYHTQLQDIYKNQTDKSIKQLEKTLKDLQEENKKKANSSNINYEIYMKKSKNARILEKKVENLDIIGLG